MLNTLIRIPMASSVFGAATSTTHEVRALPTVWKSGKVIFEALDANVWILGGTSASVEVDRTAVSTGTAPAITVGATTGAYIPMGTALEIQFDADCTHFAIEADGTGSWRGWRSDF